MKAWAFLWRPFSQRKARTVNGSFAARRAPERRTFGRGLPVHLFFTGCGQIICSGSFLLLESVVYGDTSEKLEQLFETFNVDRPADFTGHSLSVSDIVAIRQNGVVSCHYVDSVGFKELPAFLPENYLKNAEVSMEDDYGMIDGIINNGPREEPTKPTVADLEAQVNAGQTISLMDLADAVQREKKQSTEKKAPVKGKDKKPSVLAKLKYYQSLDTGKTTQRKAAERDL